VVDLHNLSLSFTESGFWITDINQPSILYNDNAACVRWCHNMTSKAARHIELCKNSVCKWVQDKTIAVRHIAGKINPADITPKRCVMGPIFVAYVTPSCLSFWTFSTLRSWNLITHVNGHNTLLLLPLLG
jgi:hypothetical protein